MMGADFIDDLLQAVHRVFPSDVTSLKEILIISGMPEETQNLRYLSYNRQAVEKDAVKNSLFGRGLDKQPPRSALVAKGLFQNNESACLSARVGPATNSIYLSMPYAAPPISLHCSGAANAAYTLLGILEIEDRGSAGIFKRWTRRIRPVLAVPGLDEAALKMIAAFEHANEIRRSAPSQRSF